MPARFRFKATAIGAGGQITVPFHDIIEVQAASALPEIGGYGKARSADFRFREILRFDVAHTEVVGSQLHDDGGEPVFSTLSKSTVEGLNIMGMVTADRIVANLVSTYRGAGQGEPSVRLIGSRFENLRIAGIPVSVHLSVDVLDKYDTYSSLRHAYATDDSARDLFGESSLGERVHELPPTVAQWLSHRFGNHSDLPAVDGVSKASLVRTLEAECAGFDCWDHVIHVEGFGTIRLGEVAISRLTRSVTMLQIDLARPVQGRLMCCSAEDGGSPW